MKPAGSPRSVSIIVPCHQAHGTIVETATSVLVQTHADWELILVSDDGSDYQATLRRAGIVDQRVRQHPVRSHRGGHVAARTRGLQLATGELVADLDADDLWRPQRLERLVPLALRHGAAQDVLECFDDTGVIGCSGPMDGRTRLLDVEAVVAFDLPFHLVTRRDRIGMQWFADNLWAPDVIRTALMAAQDPVAWLAEPLMRYRVSPSSMSQNDTGDRRMDEDYALIIERLEAGDGWGMPAAARAVAATGFRRKQALNRRHMALRENCPDLPAFVPWVLAGGATRPSTGATAHSVGVLPRQARGR